jgi:hypothetical protein
MKTELVQVAGVPETRLTPEMLALLPAEAPPAPWRARADAIIWWARPDRAAAAAIRAALPPALRRASPLTTITALLSYTYTPVGAYDEILTLLVLRQGGTVFTHVPFIAVSSPASVVGGRANWALPKTLATFSGQPIDNTAMAANGTDWQVTATAHARGPELPFLLPPLSKLVQLDAHGQTVAARVRATGRARLAQVTVEVTAPSGLEAWLPRGRCNGLLCQGFKGYLPAATSTPETRPST